MPKTAKRKPTTKQAAAAKKAAAKPGRRKRPSKAGAIRSVAKQLGRATDPAEIVAALAMKGIVVSTAQVSKTLNAKASLKRRSPTPKCATARVKIASYVDQLQTVAAKNLRRINKLGSDLAASDYVKKCRDKCREKWNDLIRLANHTND
jgi:hypothetical protein